MLKAHYQRWGISSKEVFSKIKDVIIKSLISIEPHIVNNFNRFTKHRNTCFEVYGFDVIIDAKLKAWILEVNVCPSFSSSSYLDKKVKTMMLSDAFHCIGIIPFDRKKLDKEEEKQTKNRLLGYEKNKDASKGKLVKKETDSKDFKNQLETSTLEDITMLMEYDEENSRKGFYEWIFPKASNIKSYDKYFECPRHNNMLLWNYLKYGKNISLAKYYKKKEFST